MNKVYARWGWIATLSVVIVVAVPLVYRIIDTVTGALAPLTHALGG